MTKKRRGLGNLGVDVLLSAVSDHHTEVESTQDTMRNVPLDNIRRGKYQPRIHIQAEALDELADSIRAQGLVQPVVLRPVEGGYELIAGERRWRAAQQAGLEKIPAVIKNIPDQSAAAMTLIENIQREDLNPLEEAGAFQHLIEEFELTHQQVADGVGRSRAAVSNLLRLLELEQDVKQRLERGEIEMGHARALLTLPGPAQIAAARHVVSRGLSVRETERYVRSLLNKKATPTATKSKDPDVNRLEQSLSDTLGAQVAIDYNHKGKGKLIISYNSLDELDGILSHIQ